jgi:hypothetical protein
MGAQVEERNKQGTDLLSENTIQEIPILQVSLLKHGVWLYGAAGQGIPEGYRTMGV